jgi:threonine synthase
MRIVGVRATPGTVAEGIDIAEPPRRTEVAAVVDQWITVTDEEIVAAQTELARQGLFVEPTGAVAAAAVGHLRDVDPAADVVIPLTGAGLKGLH